MTFAFAGEWNAPFFAWLREGLTRTLTARGYHACAENDPDVHLVFHPLDAERARPYRRRSRNTFVVGVARVEEKPSQVLLAAYPLLVRGLCNLVMYTVGPEGSLQTYMITPEQGCYPVSRSPAADVDGYLQEVFERVQPLASARLVVDNVFVSDLPEELWEGDEITEQLFRAGKRLDALNLLPAPFPIQDILSPADFRHLQRLYSLGGLSYGNLSARKDPASFWMSASGVNKANLRVPGKDLLLVKGYDPEREAMILSVPPHVKPNRVSVDAIEHWMIYTEHPQVGAIVHIHAWMDGIPYTEVNYPCGTYELAHSVAELVRRAPDPSRAVVGLKNHGLTITGPDLDEIFARIEGRVTPQVPMT